MSDAKSQRAETPLTVISAGDVLVGRLDMSGSGRVLGSVEGERLTCAGDLLIGPEATVDASIEARSLTIAGSVRGDVIARGRLEITRSGRLKGDAVAESLVVQEGGVHHGLLRVYPEGLPDEPPGAEPTAPARKKPGRVRRLWGEIF